MKLLKSAGVVLVALFVATFTALPANAASNSGGGDYVHVTNGQASAHAWWGEASTQPKVAKVQLCLQAYRYGAWVTKACNTKELLAGGDKYAAHRVNTRADCNGESGLFKWRSRIDVDILYQPDPDGYVYTAERWIGCGFS